MENPSEEKNKTDGKVCNQDNIRLIFPIISRCPFFKDLFWGLLYPRHFEYQFFSRDGIVYDSMMGIYSMASYFQTCFLLWRLQRIQGFQRRNPLRSQGHSENMLQKLGQQRRFCNTEEPFPKFRVAIIPTCFFQERPLFTHVYTTYFFVFSDPTQHVGRMIHPGVSSHFR